MTKNISFHITRAGKSPATTLAPNSNAVAKYHWDAIGFGDYGTLTMPELALKHMDYFYWLCNCPKLSGRLALEADAIRSRMSRIRPCSGCGADSKFVLFGSSKRLDKIRLIDEEIEEEDDVYKDVISDSSLLNCEQVMDKFPFDRSHTAQVIEGFIVLTYLEDEVVSMNNCIEFFEDSENFG